MSEGKNDIDNSDNNHILEPVSKAGIMAAM